MGAPTAALHARAAGSPNFRDGAFVSPEPTHAIAESLAGRDGRDNPAVAALRARRQGHPARPVPVLRPEFPTPASELAVTWLGHASSIVELEGRRFLLDPVFGDRVSPSLLVGPRRLHPVPCRVNDLPPLDGVLISHDHYDHLDEPTIAELERSHAPHYVVPIGVDVHLATWGVPEERITALDWRAETELGGIRLVCTEARHFSGRGFVRNATLWAGWLLRGEHRSVWFAGDTGPSRCFEEVGRDLGPVDLTLVPVGAYSDYWPEVHVTPEQAIGVHRAVTRGGPTAVMLPVHWGTFNLAMHWWSEPIRRTLRAAAQAEVPVIAPRVGERVDLAAVDSGAVDSGAVDSGAVAARFGDPWWRAAASPDDHD
ncbi:MAG: MBL fold metallo-hydrolase [Intrasporangium sp.]|uniref:MBL fold metallo-hydrolase n=1 Tax=Intrasporangium sp. TaxID=1925024 RepID=UPI0026496DEF|nr:MBL fold metallo-hydrolase [Intrasporangium sp.]MDN5798079.1 MBL fold metallo-hydrolase [Intrasporangium sp.]